ncbi:hypothetical protein NKH77_40265 [Streptomyces sp. M19]
MVIDRPTACRALFEDAAQLEKVTPVPDAKANELLATAKSLLGTLSDGCRGDVGDDELRRVSDDYDQSMSAVHVRLAEITNGD